MFKNKQYIEVNREERHYCALFMHVLLSSEVARTDFADLIKSKCEKIKLDPQRMQIFVESAAIRDYWNSLGDSKSYDEETAQNRREWLNLILKLFQFDTQIIDQQELFWTKEIGSKLWNPGHWSIDKINRSGLENADYLINIKWAFNAKPDIMIISGDQVLLVEAKLVSPEGKYDNSGEDQEKTQQRIAFLLKSLVPSFKRITFHNVLLARNTPSNEDRKWPINITWRDIIDIVDDIRNEKVLDDFTKQNFKQLRERYYAKKKIM